MDMKKEITIITLSLFLLILAMFIGAAQILINKQKSELNKMIESSYQSECDSVNQLLLESKIENGRYEIIMDRLYEKDSLLYNDITSNIE
jgi:hypothetical protein